MRNIKLSKLMGRNNRMSNIALNKQFCAKLTDSNAVEENYTWDLKDIYQDEISFNMDCLKVKEMLNEIVKYENKLVNEQIILNVLKLADDIERLNEKLYLYSHLMLDLNIEDTNAANFCAKAESLNSDVTAALAYMEPEILSIPNKTIQRFIESPYLKDYSHYLSFLLSQKQHILTSQEEELLATISQIDYDAENIYNNAIRGDYEPSIIRDQNGSDIILTEDNYSLITESSDRDLRKLAFEAFHKSYDRIKNTCSATLNASVKKDEIYARVRNYKSSLHSALEGEFIPINVFHNLIEVVNNNISYLHKYIELRKRVMKLDRVHAYDLFVPLVSSDVVEKMRYPIDKAQTIIMKAIEVLGTEYQENLKRGFENSWIDAYPKEKKHMGAYSWCTFDSHPFVLLNYDDTLDGMLTMAHEMGHALNAVFSNRNQIYRNSGYSLFTAEVASTINELIVMEYLINTVQSDDEKLYLINKQIDNIRSSIYSHVMFSEFEVNIHQKVINEQGLTATTLSNLWIDLVRKYYGEFYEVDDASGIGWIRVQHFYTEFYCYKYATSMAAAYELFKNIKEDKTGSAIEKYIAFLGKGSSEYPIDMLRKAGVDMTLTKPVNNLLLYFKSLVDSMDDILKGSAMNFVEQ